MFRALSLLAVVLAPLAIAASAPAAAPPDVETAREWIEGFKEARRGPFARIRWFCQDGTVLPAKEPCGDEHGVGIQHGEWSDRTVALREGGYEIANVLAELEPADVEAFHAAGYGRAQVLEVILGVGLKTLSNYTNHLVDTPLDAAFEKNAWEPAGAAR